MINGRMQRRPLTRRTEPGERVPRKKAQLSYWTADLKRFLAWISLAFIAGAGPNVVGQVSTWLLLGVWVALIAAALVAWLWHRRRSGIGVYVHLPNTTDRTGRHEGAGAIYRTMRKQHRDWFRSGPDQPAEAVSERAEWMLSTIEYRLDELDLRDGVDPPVYLYVFARNEGAFQLGLKSKKFLIHEKELQPLDTPPATSRSFLHHQVRTYSSAPKKGSQIYKIDLERVRRNEHDDALADIAINEIDALDSRDKINPQPRIALIVQVGSTPSNSEAFRDRTLAAASAGATTNGYLATRDDICDCALFVGIDEKNFYKQLQDGTAEPYVASLLRALSDFSNKKYGTPQIPVRLFMRGPSILAFAAGALLPPGSKYVPFDAELATADPNGSERPDRDERIIAIIDGDDVGAETERHLITGDLEKAIDYSSGVNASIERLIDQLERVPDVQLLSRGGDSVILSLFRKDVKKLEESLEELRRRNNLGISCGYGEDSKEAFVALRLAKSSGKNTTLGCSQG